MAITKEKKELIFKELEGIAKDAESVVFVNFNGITSEEINDLRTKCFDEDVKYLVAKKTLIRKVFEASEVSGDIPSMEGEIAIAYSTEDAFAAPRVIGEQSKALKDRLSIVGGVFEKVFSSKEEMNQIANIPPVKTLYAQFLMVIRAPIQAYVSVLDQISKK